MVDVGLCKHTHINISISRTIFQTCFVVAKILLIASSLLSFKRQLKTFFLRTHFLSFSFILIVYRVLEAFSLNAMLIFTLIIIIIIIMWFCPKKPVLPAKTIFARGGLFHGKNVFSSSDKKLYNSDAKPCHCLMIIWGLKSVIDPHFTASIFSLFHCILLTCITGWQGC